MRNLQLFMKQCDKMAREVARWCVDIMAREVAKELCVDIIAREVSREMYLIVIKEIKFIFI